MSRLFTEAQFPQPKTADQEGVKENGEKGRKCRGGRVQQREEEAA